jgi:hypothetical protein
MAEERMEYETVGGPSRSQLRQLGERIRGLEQERLRMQGQLDLQAEDIKTLQAALANLNYQVGVLQGADVRMTGADLASFVPPNTTPEPAKASKKARSS